MSIEMTAMEIGMAARLVCYWQPSDSSIGLFCFNPDHHTKQGLNLRGILIRMDTLIMLRVGGENKSLLCLIGSSASPIVIQCNTGISMK